MHILILNWRDLKNPHSGGAEIVTMEHAMGWKKAGHKITWFASRFKDARYAERISGINIVRAGNSLTVRLHAMLFYLFSGIKFDLVIDEIHGIPFFTPLYVRKPKIAFIHEVAAEIWDYMYPFPLNKIGRISERLMLAPYRRILFLTVSNSTADELKRVGIKKIKIIINGIKIKKLKNLRKEKDPTFIFVSRVVKMKGIEDVIKSFFHILKELKNAKLWIVGDGDGNYIRFLKRTRDTYAIKKKIHFLGRVNDEEKLRLMKRAHVLLHASVKEGWGLVVLEAASQGTPSVVYNVPGLKDSVKNGITGTVLKKNDPKEMAKSAVNLLKDREEYEKFSENGVVWAKSLSWEKSVKESLRIITSHYEKRYRT